MNNPFMFLLAVIELGASGWAIWHGNVSLGVMYFSWAVSSVVLGRMG
jgi:hypothetical protein